MRAKDACTSSRQYGHALRGLGRERIQRNTQACPPSIAVDEIERNARALACLLRPLLR